MLHIILVTGAALIIVTSISYADFKEGYTAYTRGDYKTALSEFKSLAEQGDAEAQHSLGVMYVNGEGVDKDVTKGVNWFRKSAEQGFADAQHNLAFAYETGLSVKKDMNEAARWYHKAAEQGFAKSQSNLGLMYSSGDGVQKDLIEGGYVDA